MAPLKYAIDCEFLEDGRTIDLLSIAVVAEDGREYYAVSRDCNMVSVFADKWLVEHVVPHLPMFKVRPDEPWSWANFQEDVASGLWRRRAAIADDLRAFCDPELYGRPEFWGYFSAYDHVALCQLFGRMIDLPQGWPMLTYDLRQALDHCGLAHIKQPDDAPHSALEDARWVLQTLNRHC